MLAKPQPSWPQLTEITQFIFGQPLSALVGLLHGHLLEIEGALAAPPPTV
jgi:hypothetical protein